jgi:hypothetical protein
MYLNFQHLLCNKSSTHVHMYSIQATNSTVLMDWSQQLETFFSIFVLISSSGNRVETVACFRNAIHKKFISLLFRQFQFLHSGERKKERKERKSFSPVFSGFINESIWNGRENFFFPPKVWKVCPFHILEVNYPCTSGSCAHFRRFNFVPETFEKKIKISFRASSIRRGLCYTKQLLTHVHSYWMRSIKPLYVQTILNLGYNLSYECRHSKFRVASICLQKCIPANFLSKLKQNFVCLGKK